MLPDFFVIGAQKAGSTYLLECLNDHPQVFMPPVEVAFFEDSLYSAERIEDFEQNFRPAQPGQVIGVKRPNLLGHPECPERLQRHMPNLKIIAILRHPVDRAISAYFHYMKTGLLPIVPVEIGLRKILQGEYSQIPRAYEVLEFGLYGKHLRRYADFFPRKNILVFLLEDMKHNAQKQLSELYQFIGVDANFRPASFDSRPMKAPYSITRLKIFDIVDRHCRTWSEDGKYFTRRRGFLRAALAATNNTLDRMVWSRFFTEDRPQLSAQLKCDLVTYYTDDVKLLEDWMGRSINSWLGFSNLK